MTPLPGGLILSAFDDRDLETRMMARRTPSRFGGMRRFTSLLIVGGLLATGCASSGTIQKPKKKGPLHYYRMGKLFYEQGKVEQALAELDRSLALDDSLPQTYLLKGQILWSVDRCEEAIPEFEKALAINVYFTDARMYLAECLERVGKPDEALEVLAVASQDRRFPFPEKVLFNIAMIHLRAGRLDEALSNLRRSVELRPRYYLAHFEMAKILEQLGRLDEALQAFEAAEPGFPKDPGFLYRYGFALYRSGRQEHARRILKRVIDLAPGSESAAKAAQLLGAMG